MVPSVATEKSPVTPLGIDPETFRLAAQCLNLYATSDPLTVISILYKCDKEVNIIKGMERNISMNTLYK
jgi:hypothetical protein